MPSVLDKITSLNDVELIRTAINDCLVSKPKPKTDPKCKNLLQKMKRKLKKSEPDGAKVDRKIDGIWNGICRGKPGLCHPSTTPPTTTTGTVISATLIIGGVLGAIVLILAVIGGVMYCMKKKKKPEDPFPSTPPQPSPAPPPKSSKSEVSKVEPVSIKKSLLERDLEKGFGKGAESKLKAQKSENVEEGSEV